MYGYYKKLVNANECAFTGRGIFLRRLPRPQRGNRLALLYFTREMLKTKGEKFKDKKVVISGSGNVAIYANEKATQMGAKVIAMSDSDGYIYDKDGVDVEIIKKIKEVERKRISEYPRYRPDAKYIQGCNGIWTIPCDIALPCATQNELDAGSASALIKNGCIAVAEGANMPCTLEAVKLFLDFGVLFAPAKAANAGGVATSALEMAQASQRMFWSFDRVDKELDNIMVNIFKQCADAAQEYGFPGNYVVGANIAGFVKSPTP